MSLKVTLEEQPRVFTVKVGEREIGKVTSYRDKRDLDDEAYHADRFTNDEDKEDQSLGWHNTLEEAGLKVVEYDHGSTKITKIMERIF